MACRSALSGFFGIGGGFLVIPGLIAETDMPMISAVGSSLLSVTAFGLTTAASYALSGLIDWWLAAVFIAGGIAGGLLGARAAKQLSTGKETLRLIFAGLVAVVGVYVVTRGDHDADRHGRRVKPYDGSGDVQPGRT